MEHLARHLSSPVQRVIKDAQGPGFVYESVAFATCSHANEVLEVAREELRILSGVLRIARDSPEALSTGAVFKENGADGRDIFLFLSDGVRARCELGEFNVADGNGNVVATPPKPSKVTSISQLASASPAVAKAMRLLAASDYNTWSGLYRLYEVIEADVGGKRQLKETGWGSAKDVERFKRSANSVAVAGDSARHGEETELPPPHPMSLDEANAYLWSLVNSWLASKNV